MHEMQRHERVLELHRTHERRAHVNHKKRARNERRRMPGWLNRALEHTWSFEDFTLSWWEDYGKRVRWRGMLRDQARRARASYRAVLRGEVPLRLQQQRSSTPQRFMCAMMVFPRTRAFGESLSSILDAPYVGRKDL